MVQPTPLYVNGGDPIQCANCGAYLGNERAVAQLASGVKYFCKSEPFDVTDTCYLAYLQRNPLERKQ